MEVFWSLGFRVWGFGFVVQGLGCRVLGLVLLCGPGMASLLDLVV